MWAREVHDKVATVTQLLATIQNLFSTHQQVRDYSYMGQKGAKCEGVAGQSSGSAPWVRLRLNSSALCALACALVTVMRRVLPHEKSVIFCGFACRSAFPSNGTLR